MRLKNPARKRTSWFSWKIVFVTDYEKVKLRLNELRTLLKNNKYSDHIISNAFYNTAKLQGIAPKPKNNFNNIHLVTTFHEDVDNKIIILKEK